MANTLLDLLTTNPLQGLLDEAVAAAQRSLDPQPEHITALREQIATLTSQLQAWNTQRDRGIEAYNQARLTYFFAQVRAAGLAWCKRGNHLVPADQLRRVHVTGAHYGSGYNDSLRGYTNEMSCCIEHALELRGGPGQYDGEYTSYTTEKEVCTGWEQYFEARLLTEKLAAEYGVPPVLTFQRAQIGWQRDECYLLAGPLRIDLQTSTP